MIVPEGRQIFTRLTVLENLKIGGNIRDDCDRAYIMLTGKVIAEGSGEELLQDDQLTAAYLG